MEADLSIFVCYRRSDTGGEAVALTDKLNCRRGFAVFKDVDNIRPGQDWVDAIDELMDRCDVLLVLIGPDWIGDSGDEGHILDENDHVRREIEAALTRKKAVIPIRFGGASLPASQQLPKSLRPLLRRQSLEIRNSTFNRDLEVLVTELRAIARQKAPPRPAPAPPPPPPPEPTEHAVLLPAPIVPPGPPPPSDVVALPPRNQSRALIGAVGVLLVLLVSVGVLYALHIGPFAASAAASPTPPPTVTATATASAAATPAQTPTLTPTAAPTGTANPSTPPPPTPTPSFIFVEVLKQQVPSAYVASCLDQTATTYAYEGSIASLKCSTAGVDAIYYDLFETQQALSDFHAREMTTRSVSVSDQTRCDAGSLDIAYHFEFGNGTRLGGPGYRLMCFTSDTNSAWLEQANPVGPVMITIQREDGDQAKLWDWWTRTGTLVMASPSPSP